MKKYRTKIETPWLEEGIIFSGTDCGLYKTNIPSGLVCVDPSNFPDFFEEIPERSEVEKLSEWMYNAHYIGREAELQRYPWDALNIEAKEIQRKIARKIIDSGVDVTPITKGME